MPAEGALRHRLGPGDRLIETLGYKPGEGAVRAHLHRSRMANSAARFGIPFDLESFDAALAGLAVGDHPLRLRLTIDPEGGIEVAASPFVPLPEGTVWRLAVARTRLASTDPLLPHKTSLRASYDIARAEFPANAAEEVILLNERGEVCEGTLTNVFADMGDGVLATPPLHCGLLAGVLRAHLLATGRSVERVLTLAHLERAHTLYVGNSLRGLIRAELVS